MKKQIKFEDFVACIEKFVSDNFRITGCRECHETGNGEIMPDNWKGQYDKALKDLYKAICK